MQLKKIQKLFHVVLEYKDGDIRTVPVRASTLSVAEDRALKRNPLALRIKSDG